MPDPSMLKLGAVALAGYVLGRMKKGRAAVGLAMWAAGVKMDPKELLRQGVLNLANSDQGKELLTQLRGPMLEAGRKAAGATIENQLASLTSALEKRTSAITQGAGKAGDQAGDKAGDAAEGASGEVRDRAAALNEGSGKVTGLIGRRKNKRKAQAEEDSAPAAEETAEDESGDAEDEYDSDEYDEAEDEYAEDADEEDEEDEEDEDE